MSTRAVDFAVTFVALIPTAGGPQERTGSFPGPFLVLVQWLPANKIFADNCQGRRGVIKYNGTSG